METMTHPPDAPVTIRLDLARAVMAYLGTRPYAEVTVIANAIGGVLWEWERDRERAAMGEDSAKEQPGQSAASSGRVTGPSSDSGAKTTPSASPSGAPVPTHGPTDVPGVAPRPNGRLANV